MLTFSCHKPTSILLLISCLAIFYTLNISAQELDEPQNTFNGDIIQSGGAGCPSGTEQAPSSDVSMERQIVVLLNNLRVANGLPPVKISAELTAAARFHARDMCQKNYFAHASQDGSGNVTCQTFDRIGAFYTWTAAAENLAAGYFDAQSAFNGWVNSPGHYSNMMSALVYEVGIGYYYDASASYITRWVMDLGRKANVFPVIINNEEVFTTTPQVNLYKYVAAGYNELRVKTDNGAWSAWQPATNTLSWNMNTSGAGTCVVYCELKNASGNILSSSDDIDVNIAGGGTSSSGVVIKVKIALQGTYNTTNQSMNTNLRNSNLLPTTQPFNRPPWNYNGSESVSSASAIPTNAVDWVLLEARNGNNNDQIAETKAAFLLSNGNIVDVNGTTQGVVFSSIAANAPYFISVKTRNHLAILSANAVTVPNTATLDLTNPTNVLGGAAQLANMGNGVYALIAGDMDANGTITVNDFNYFQAEMSIINSYVDSDCNMDKNVTVADLNLYSPNMSKIGVAQIRY